MKSRRIWIAPTVVVAVGAIVAFVLFRQGEGPEVAARTIAEAIVNNDPRAMYKYESELESNALGLTEEKYVDFWNKVVSPKLEGLTPEDNFRSYPTNEGTTGVGELYLTDGSGSRFLYDGWVDVEDDGRPRNFLVHSKLIQAWLIDYMRARRIRSNESLSDVDMLYAYVEGARRDAPLLREIGIEGFASHEEIGKVRTWDEFIIWCQEQIKKREDPNFGKPTPPRPPVR